MMMMIVCETDPESNSKNAAICKTLQSVRGSVFCHNIFIALVWYMGNQSNYNIGHNSCERFCYFVFSAPPKFKFCIYAAFYLTTDLRGTDFSEHLICLCYANVHIRVYLELALECEKS